MLQPVQFPGEIKLFQRHNLLRGYRQGHIEPGSLILFFSLHFEYRLIPGSIARLKEEYQVVYLEWSLLYNLLQHR